MPFRTQSVMQLTMPFKLPLWIEWIEHHWFAILLILLAIAAIIYVWSKRSSLFYRE